jgi:biotin transport system substrate-specific component
MVTSALIFLSYDSSKKEGLYAALQIFLASIFLALCSQISIPLFLSPVPMTGQTLGVMLIGATLGSRKAFLSVLAYLIEGSLGLPVFAGGAFGFMRLLGPTGGYLVGFLLQAYCVGWFIERQASFRILKALPIFFVSSLLTLGSGVIWLSLFVTNESAMTIGFYPFLLVEALKAVLVTLYLGIKQAVVHAKRLSDE